jgi:glycosyltransferase involved in cell wall biosynthesis
MADKIIQLLDDPVRRAKMGQFGRIRVEDELNWDRQVSALVGAYTRVMQKRRG